MECRFWFDCDGLALMTLWTNFGDFVTVELRVWGIINYSKYSLQFQLYYLYYTNIVFKFGIELWFHSFTILQFKFYCQNKIFKIINNYLNLGNSQ